MKQAGEISLIVLSVLFIGASVFGIGAGTAVKNQTSITKTKAADIQYTCKVSGVSKPWGTCVPVSGGVVQCFPNDPKAVNTIYGGKPYTG